MKPYKVILLNVFVLLVTIMFFSQIGIETITPYSYSILDIKSTSQGISPLNNVKI
ncbi:hypothetical protein GOQ30_14890 [Flavobacterium sp. TP390]|uniref:Uncharacterized protein n=1 Tax=Flavobacterium profundi TaxID=1774945 RepID=A0A6I4IU77_9FLAO|nr:hypothetical protein [Flavobacterium profundi]MVO10459.1 hypothetical protein [Flavobacterium profundi]